jgi:hypothetical protein
MLNKIHSEKPNKQILTENDMLLLSDLQAYRKNVEEHCARILVEAKEEADLLKQSLITDAKIELEKTVLALKQDNQTRLNELLNTLSNNLSQILYKILKKLRINQIDPLQLETIIKQDLSELLKLKHIKLVANPANLINIQAAFSQKLQNKIEYVEDDSFSDSMCQLETADSIIKLDFERCEQEIYQIINDTFLMNTPEL